MPTDLDRPLPGPPEAGPLPSVTAEEVHAAPEGTGWGRYGRKPVLVLAGVGLVDAMDRGILAGVLVPLQADLGLTDVQLGLLDTAYVIAGLLIALPAGYLADRRRRTRIVSVVLGFWAVISAATAAAANFAQLFAARTALGIGETVDDPAARSLVCDYYPARIRSRAFSYLRVTPSVGRALGIALGGAVGAVVGWRWAFVLVGVPGSLLAFYVWRLPEPRRGESDGPVRVGPEPPARRTVWQDWADALRIPSLRALMLGTAITNGALMGIAFWAAAYHQRHSGMTLVEATSITGALILLGSISGTLIGGRLGDRMHGVAPAAPMWFAGASTALGAVFLFLSVQDGIPIWTARVPLQILAIGLLVCALPATIAMTGEVTPARIRGTAFSMVRLTTTLIGAFSPPVLGWLALRQATAGPNGEAVGDLGFAFAASLPLLLVGALVLAFGGRTVGQDRDLARLG